MLNLYDWLCMKYFEYTFKHLCCVCKMLKGCDFYFRTQFVTKSKCFFAFCNIIDWMSSSNANARWCWLKKLCSIIWWESHTDYSYFESPTGKNKQAYYCSKSCSITYSTSIQQNVVAVTYITTYNDNEYSLFINAIFTFIYFSAI